MNGHCSTCDVEARCGYPYKPCDCCDYRKYVPAPKELEKVSAQIIDFFTKGKTDGSAIPHI